MNTNLAFDPSTVVAGDVIKYRTKPTRGRPTEGIVLDRTPRMLFVKRAINSEVVRIKQKDIVSLANAKKSKTKS